MRSYDRRESDTKTERSPAEANRLLFPDLSRDRYMGTERVEIVIGKEIVTRERSNAEMTELLFPRKINVEISPRAPGGFVERRRIARH